MADQQQQSQTQTQPSTSVSNRVKVGVRVRPLNDTELEAGAASVIAHKGPSITANHPSRSTKFDFDWAFGPNSTQHEVYDSMCQPLIEVCKL